MRSFLLSASRGGKRFSRFAPPARSANQIATLIALCALSACGFEPVHSKATRAQWSHQLESIEIVTNPTREAQLLKAEITDQINPTAQSAPKAYTVNIAFTETEVSLFINPDGTSGRGDLQYHSSYTVTRLSDHVVIERGNLLRVSSYNIAPTADYATYVSREDAQKRGILELAQDYKLRLINLLTKLNDPNAKEVKPILAPVLPLLRPLPGQQPDDQPLLIQPTVPTP